PEERTHYLPNFVDTTLTMPLPWSDYGVPEDVPLVVALGRLHANKAFDTLISAMAKLPGVWLWIAGEGPERATLEAHAEKMGVADRVKLIGWIDDAGSVIEAADIVCVPSRHEPLGNVILEAWARGRPVVAAASEGPSQLIEHDRTGVLAAIDDAESLATALTYVLENPDAADRLAEAGMARYEQDFAEEAIIEQYLDLYARVIEMGPYEQSIGGRERRLSGIIGR
ncbi:MAG: glycosyltransferase family 4 protein, partial [Pseudomonadota bacterium]